VKAQESIIPKDYLAQVSALIAEALRAGVSVHDLSHSVAFPFGKEVWPGKGKSCFVAMEIARFSIELTHGYIQAAIRETGNLESKKGDR
jgi:hypothetical protein